MAIYSLHHSAIGKTTHAAGTAGAHIAYVTRHRAASAVLSARLPMAAPGKAAEARAWFDEHEARSRKNARIADKIMLALPIDLDEAQRSALVADFAEAATSGRAPWLAAIHGTGKDRENPHAHVVIVDRDPRTGRRAVGLSEKGSTDRLRALWEQSANAALKAAGVVARIDRRSLQAQGVDRIATIHQGPQARAIETRGVRPISQARECRNGAGAKARTRVVDYPAIDAGRTRSDCHAEIVAENAAHADERRLAAIAATWEDCARQLEADAAERKVAQRAALERELDRREHRARVRLAALTRPIKTPLALVEAREVNAAAEASARAFSGTATKTAACLTALEAERPVGLWSWLSGEARRHDQEAAILRREAEENARQAKQATATAARAKLELDAREDAWKRRAAKIETRRRRQRALVNEARAWIADARAVLSTATAAIITMEMIVCAVERLRDSRRGAGREKMRLIVETAAAAQRRLESAAHRRATAALESALRATGYERDEPQR